MANNLNRKAIEFLVQGALPPHSTNVLWMDTSVPDKPILKIWWNGAWVSVHYVKDDGWIKPKIVPILPARGESDVLYLVPLEHPETQNLYAEYLWVENAWEKIGSEEVDLSDYYTKEEIAELLTNKQDTLTAGDNISIDENNSISALGYTYNTTKHSFAEGTSTASGDYSHAEGSGNLSSGLHSHTEGDSNVASGQSSHVEGGSNIATADCAHAEGAYTAAAGMCSHSEGFGSSTNAPFTISGAANATTYTMSVATPSFLINTIVRFNGVFAKVTAKPTTTSFTVDKTLSATQALNNATIQIIKGVAYDSCSHAEGYLSNAVGLYSHTEGYDSVAEEYCGHAEGRGTKAGNLSHAEGDTSIAKGQVSHAEGQATQALGVSSHSEGYNTVAGENYSHAEGYLTIAQNEAEHAEGKYNVSHKISPVEFVDMGVSVLWAKCNLGAAIETDPGDLYAWGETIPKTEFSWDNYKFGTQYNLTKYNSTDNLITLQPEDDAATVAYGNGWRIPYESELVELWNNCSAVWDSNGVTLTSKTNGNTLYFPYNYYNSKAYTPEYLIELWFKNRKASSSNAYYAESKSFNYHANWPSSSGTYKQRFSYGGVRPVIETDPTRLTQHSIGIGSLNNRKNAVEVMDNGDVYVYGVGNYEGTDIKVQDATIKTLQEYIASLEARIAALEGN